jgi:putative RNA 2'-phosphotransferase
MHKDGHVFYISKNGVWLTKEVPIEYMEEVWLILMHVLIN